MNSRNEYMEIPVKAFETLHLQTYHSHFVNAFANAACLIDAQLIVSQQLHREVSPSLMYRCTDVYLQ